MEIPTPPMINRSDDPPAAAIIIAGFKDKLRRDCLHAYSTKVQQAVEYLINYYDDPRCTIKLMQKHLSITSHTFNKLFLKGTGVTIQQFLTDLRRDTALELLVRTQLRIKSIVTYSGFNSYSAMLRALKQTFGDPPTRLREK